MTVRPAGSRDRWIEGVLWGLVLAVGGLVFVPAALEFFEGRKIEAQEKKRLLGLEEKLVEQDRIASWLVNDPETDDKLYEHYFR